MPNANAKCHICENKRTQVKLAVDVHSKTEYAMKVLKRPKPQRPKFGSRFAAHGKPDLVKMVKCVI